MGQWIVGVISFQKIFGHLVEIRRDVTLVHGQRTEHEDRARILEPEFAIHTSASLPPKILSFLLAIPQLHCGTQSREATGYGATTSSVVLVD